MQLTPKPTINYKEENAHGTPMSTGSGSSKMDTDEKRSPGPANAGGTNFMETMSVEESTFQYGM